MNRRARIALFAVAASGFAALLVWGTTGIPDWGHYRGQYGKILTKAPVKERQTTNAVTAIVFDYRGFDTLGEEFILFAAAVGGAILLRADRDERALEAAADLSNQRADVIARPIRAVGAALVAPTVVLGGYIVAHGALTPGGGFQGGVVLASAAVLVYTSGQYLALRRVRGMTPLELADALGAAGFALIALGGLIFGTAALDNFLGFGVVGSLYSGGIIPLANVSVGIEVAGGVTLIVAEFLDQALMRRRA
jgi:multicomponent Na+:H+ antiporter subunit B